MHERALNVGTGGQAEVGISAGYVRISNLRISTVRACNIYHVVGLIALMGLREMLRILGLSDAITTFNAG